MSLLLASASFLLCSCSEKPSAPEKAGHILQSSATEISGLAFSRYPAELLWIHNDKGTPVLHAVDAAGRPRGTVRVQGVKNINWEDIASFELDGKSWLLIADTGDNSGRRKDCSLIIVAEPEPSTLSTTQEVFTNVSWQIPVAYPDEPHDCEAVAVDAGDEKVYLFTKRTTPPAVYVLPLRNPADGKAGPAKLVARLNYIPQPNSRQKIFPTPTGRYRAQVTGADIAGDSTAAVVLTYGEVMLYPRHPGESWSTVFNRPPILLAPHGLPQAEAICFSKDGRSLFVTGEHTNPLLLRYRLTEPRSK